jgi:UDP-N-acetylmuramyl pentapeptide phosphotransferase/UDP-N-acetylglucosamine-1-phosphate transferase
VFAGGSGLLLYIVMAIIMPTGSKLKTRKEVGEKIKDLALEIKEKVRGIAENKEKDNKKPIIGGVVLILGVMLLASKLIPGWWQEMFWPIVLVIVGVYLIFRN